MMDNNNYRKVLIQEASKWGLILGITVFALSLVGNSFGTVLAIVSSLLQVAVMFVINMNVGRIMAPLRDKYTFGNSMGTILLTMVFAGVIIGAGEYIIQLNTPDYFDKIFELQLERFKNNAEYTQIITENRGMIERIMGNPLTMLISGVINMVLFGGIVGLVNSAYLRNDRKID
ncbi:MAG: DUF4199 domain-containing protein [Rikenellaceae bacterium]|nr:DUF4199 domain-containing protein [Rikenellaceae bacterium]